MAALVAVLVADLSAQKDTPKDRLGNPLGWTGIIRRVITFSEKVVEPQFSRSGRADFEAIFIVNPDGSVSVTARGQSETMTTDVGGRSSTTKLEGSRQLKLPPFPFAVRIEARNDAAGTYDLSCSGALNEPRLKGTAYNREATRQGVTESSGKWEDQLGFSVNVKTQSKNDASLVGKEVVTDPMEMLEKRRSFDFSVLGGLSLEPGRVVTVTTTWNLKRKENLKLVVDIPEYDLWMPDATYDPTVAGHPLLVKASLRNKDGSPASEKAAKFTFELVGVSHEPGVCMNYPAPKKDQKAEDEEPDLQFDEQLPENKNLNILNPEGKAAKTGRGLKAETLPDPAGYKEAKAQIGSYDWGGYGELLVTAEMPDGRQIVGYLETDNTNPYILIPKRKGGSLVADAWRDQWRDEVPNILDLADDDDSEDDPKRAKQQPGPGMCKFPAHKCKGGHQGDGLTLYEEYRGFYVGGQHVSGHPGKKDLFLHNRVGGSSELGIIQFRNLTRTFMEVHDGLQEDEIGPRQIVNYFPEADSGLHDDVTHGLRVWINPNVSVSTPTRGKQYGICVDSSLYLPPGWSYGMGHPGAPKKLALNPGNDVTRKFHTGDGRVLEREFGYMAATHEILHCCNVAHHGDSDLGYVLWKVEGTNLVEIPPNADGNFDLNSRQRKVFPMANLQWEDGYSVPAFELQRWLSKAKNGGVVYVARQGGQHSDYQDCVMRYIIATAFIKPGKEDFRYLNRRTGELIGGSLCDTFMDSEIPGLGLPKLNRYGDATNGYCRSQICINDPRHKHTTGFGR
jgi:hypothetical protein